MPKLKSAPMDTFQACSIIEGFCGGEDAPMEQQYAAWQSLIDSGAAWTLQGFYGRTAARLIEAGICHAARPARKAAA